MTTFSSEIADRAASSNTAVRPGAETNHFVPRIGVRRFSFREFALAAVAMLLTVTAVMFPHIMNGGFTLDDWSTYSGIVVRGGSLSNDISYLLGQEHIRARPLTGVLLAVGMNVFGFHMGVWLAFAAGLAAWMGVTVFAILRALGLGMAPAFAVGAFSVLTPIADTLRLWAIAGTVQLPISLALTGILTALYAFRAERRSRAYTLHGISILCYASSLLFVETALLLCAGAVVLYLFVAPRRVALRRWLVDVTVLGIIYVTVTSNTSYERQSLGGALDHTWIIIDQSRVLLTTVVFPFGAGAWWALLPPVMILVGAGIVVRSLPRTSQDRGHLIRWLSVTLGGVGVLVAGYAPYAFADAYYSPLTVGMGNRTNALAAVGWALVVVGLVILAGWLIYRDLPRARVLTAATATVVLAVVAATYVDRYREDAGRYRVAFDTAAAALVTVKRAVVVPPSGSMFYVSGQPLEAALGVPIFNTTWDLNGAVKYAYDRYDVRALPVFVDLALRCGSSGITPTLSGVEQAGFASSYRKTFFVDGLTGKTKRIDDVAACREASATWPRNPAQPAVPG